MQESARTQSLAYADAGELIHIFIPLIQARASARSIVDAEFIHPTFSGLDSMHMRDEDVAVAEPPSSHP